MRNLISAHTHTHKKGGNQEVERAAQGAGVTERLYGKNIYFCVVSEVFVATIIDVLLGGPNTSDLL